jgi:hypothetical protein
MGYFYTTTWLGLFLPRDLKFWGCDTVPSLPIVTFVIGHSVDSLGRFLCNADLDMQLRDHPLMSHRGVRNWPPRWVITQSDDKPMSGEVGIFENALDPPDNKLIIVMKLDDQKYTATLMFDDATFCIQIPSKQARFDSRRLSS